MSLIFLTKKIYRFNTPHLREKIELTLILKSIISTTYVFKKLKNTFLDNLMIQTFTVVFHFFLKKNIKWNKNKY